jgi:hypothetical protein
MLTKDKVKKSGSTKAELKQARKQHQAASKAPVQEGQSATSILPTIQPASAEDGKESAIAGVGAVAEANSSPTTEAVVPQEKKKESLDAKEAKEEKKEGDEKVGIIEEKKTFKDLGVSHSTYQSGVR